MQLDSEDRLQAANVARFDEKAVSDLRERFIASCASRSRNPDRSRHRAAFALRPWALATTAVQPDRQCADRWCKRRAGGGFGVAQRRIAASRGCQWPRAHRTGESVAARWRPGSGPVHLTEIAKAHGGRMAVTSSAETGTVFGTHLPIVADVRGWRAGRFYSSPVSLTSRAICRADICSRR
jgi:hypothetical protein